MIARRKQPIAAQSLVDLAYRRTLTLLHNFHLMNHNLKALLASTYLQGVEHVCLTFFAKSEIARQGWSEEDYQI